jgi:hypothetical protein
MRMGLDSRTVGQLGSRTVSGMWERLYAVTEAMRLSNQLCRGVKPLPQFGEQAYHTVSNYSGCWISMRWTGWVLAM